ncbi:hypothetical protein AB1Y20_003617 [Prymnesium parvum]|uniref:Uncharacterized protein n=1 Tax=Prymnesium parvum TaxID=97485 RepID=A0AB34J534_PRYPA|mmetsp:Transcript_42786/g.106524  ORF Transcript_42786/g.106524 Transcript_42786/m.106524 type:complete len:85 (-) Transcript_42786:129-383(-)
MQMLASAKDSIERKLNRGNGYSTVSNSETQMDALSDDFYSQQLRSDGWHLDEVEDDEQLDFSFPPSRTSRSKLADCCRIFSCCR